MMTITCDRYLFADPATARDCDGRVTNVGCEAPQPGSSKPSVRRNNAQQLRLRIFIGLVPRLSGFTNARGHPGCATSRERRPLTGSPAPAVSPKPQKAAGKSALFCWNGTMSRRSEGAPGFHGRGAAE